MSDQAAILIQLKWALQALAQPAGIQVALFPPFVCIADELALDLEHWYRVTKTQSLPIDPRAFAVIEQINVNLANLSNRQNTVFWSVEGLESDFRWDSIRELAREALMLAGWELSQPPFQRSLHAPIDERKADSVE